jgi:hypothetical protein
MTAGALDLHLTEDQRQLYGRTRESRESGA